LYVGNGDSGTIVKVTPQGTASTFFSNPYGDTSGLVFDSHGILYDAQLGTGEIDQLTPDGKISLFVSGLDHPQAGTFDPEGNLYVLTGETLSGANVVRITPAGAMSTFATGVTGLVWDAQGDLYEGNGTGALTITTPSGSTSTIASGLTFPIPLGVDARGDVYVWQSSSKEELDLISGSGDVTPLQSIPHGLIATIAVPEPGITLACAAILTALPWRRRRSKPSTV
jgi:sugar lactone lactonase YvrE